MCWIQLVLYAHDRLENNGTIDPSELKLAVEQTLCLLGSTNTQLSILPRNKVLASVNRSKIDLDNQALLNALKRSGFLGMIFLLLHKKKLIWLEN